MVYLHSSTEGTCWWSWAFYGGGSDAHTARTRQYTNSSTWYSILDTYYSPQCQQLDLHNGWMTWQHDPVRNLFTSCMQHTPYTAFWSYIEDRMAYQCAWRQEKLMMRHVGDPILFLQQPHITQHLFLSLSLLTTMSQRLCLCINQQQLYYSDDKKKQLQHCLCYYRLGSYSFGRNVFTPGQQTHSLRRWHQPNVTCS